MSIRGCVTGPFVLPLETTSPMRAVFRPDSTSTICARQGLRCLQVFLTVGVLMALTSAEANAQFVLAGHDYLPGGLQSGDGAQTALTSIGLAVPIEFGKASTTQGFRLRRASTQRGQDWPNGASAPDPYWEIRYEASLAFPAGGAWRATVYLSPGLASDLAGPVGPADWDFKSALLLEKRSWGIGVAYRSRFDTKVVPLLRLSRDLTDALSLDVFLPGRAAIWRTGASGRQSGLQFRLTAGSFNLAEDALGRADFTIVTVGPAARIPFSGDRLALQFNLGVVLVNTVELGSGAAEIPIKRGTGVSLGVALLAL